MLLREIPEHYHLFYKHYALIMSQCSTDHAFYVDQMD